MSKVIPYRFYQTPEGARVSIYSSFVPAGATLITQGFTVEHPDGTTGLGRKAFDTESEAQAWCDANPRFRGMSQY